MTPFERGDIVLVDLVFTQGGGSKRRPALVLSGSSYRQNRQEVIVAAITSNCDRLRAGDSRVKSWRDAGLIHPSLVTAILQTVKGSSITRRLGRLAVEDLATVERNLRKALELR